MLAIVGTVPDENFPLIHGRVGLSHDHITINDQKIEINRGTPALLAAAIKTKKAIDSPEIYAFLVGDIGKGDGSRKLYRFLTEHISEFQFQVMTFHYLLPDVDWHNRVLFAIEKMKQKPLLIADAGFMYVAKMSGQAEQYDIFTPDVGELAFLADEMAPHPFYTRGFILHQEENAPDLIKLAYKHKNAARYLLVKGKSDYIVSEKKIIETIKSPSLEPMEAIGGTGDTLTGILTVLCGVGYKPAKAAAIAAKVNRWCGSLTNPGPATQVYKLINKIPEALLKVLDNG